MDVSEVTRRNIIDGLSVEGVNWAGRLTEPDFLSRLFDLNRLPSHDHRYRTAYADIWQHRVNNRDEEVDWVFHDARFNLLRCDDELFLRFLSEMIHPVVRTDPEEVQRLHQLFNEHLRHDGFELVERAQISARPVFAARRFPLAGAPSPTDSLRAIDELNAGNIARQITRMEAAVHADPDLAIGTAKELIESCCKTILKERGQPVSGNPDLPQLVRLVVQALDLVPSDVPAANRAAETVRTLLRTLATIPQSVAELRNLHGTGHGKEADAPGLEARHARLAVNAATAIAVFLFESHQGSGK